MFAVLSCLLAGGCLLTTSLSGLEGPSLSTTTDDDSGPDGFVASIDASEAGDASSDETPDSAPKTCTALFCASFDKSTTVTDGWDTEISPKGSIALETSVFVSAPHAFAATVRANTDFQAATLTKFISLPPPVAMQVDMQVYFDQVDYSMGGMSFVVMGLENPGGAVYSHARIFVNDGSSVQLSEQYSGGEASMEHHVVAPYAWPLQRWVRVHLEVTATRIMLTLDGTLYATLTKHAAWDQDKTLTQTMLKVGIFYVAGAQQRVVIDDVVFDNK